MDTTQGVLNLYKRRGETPLSRIQRFKIENPEFKTVKMTYAGRLDPLAEGILLVVYGDEIRNKKDYLELDKKYVFEMVFGIETDTYDVLGKIINSKTKIINPKKYQISDELKNFIGKRTQLYPAYSSKTVGGKPLFNLAKEGKLDQIEIPKREVEIYDLRLTGKKMFSKSQLQEFVYSSIGRIKGDFRQEEIIKLWETFFLKSKRREFRVLKFHVHCGSGTYVRSLVHELGKRLKTGATTISIKRTDVGKYSIHSAVR